MLHLLPDTLPWYIAGPGFGLCVVALYALTNNHLGVSGSYAQLLNAFSGTAIEVWRLWFLGGLLLGGVVAVVLGSDPQHGLAYGRLGALVPIGLLLPLLFAGSLVLGFGVRWAGACTSGHGISGSSTRSPGSMVSVATFMVTAVLVTFLLHVVTGGAL